jgi:hypothetical protein
LCTECSEGERQYGEGSKRELVPQRDRNSVVKENRGYDQKLNSTMRNF